MPGRLAPADRRHRCDPAGAAGVRLAGLPLAGWAIAAVLWLAAQMLAAVLARLPPDTGNLAPAGMLGIGTSFRAFAVVIVLVAVTVADEQLGLAAALLYALAYTLELGVSLLAYFGSGGEA